MDPQKVEELDNGFFELNESVRQTNLTFLDVLGPMANQLKQQLAKQLNQAATDQDNTTSSLEDSYKKINDADIKQQELYRQQLRRRGYDIDQSGKEIKTTQELSISQQEFLDKLDKRIEKENQLLQASDKPVQSFRELASSTNSIGGIFNKLEDKMFEFTGKSVGAAMGLNVTIAAVTGITKAFSVVTDSIFKGERGSEVSAKGFTEFSGALTKAAYGIAAAMLVLPIGPIAKIASVAIALATAAVERATKMVEDGAKINNDLYKSYNRLSEKGLTTAKGMSGLKDSLHNVGLTASEIDKFNQLLGDNSKNLALFGGTAATGLAKFEKIAKTIATPDSKLNKEFLLMGINSDAQRAHIMKYMTEEEKLGLSKGLSDEQNIQGAKKYIDNLDKLSMLTGNNRQELEDARATVMANENLRAAIFAAEQDKSEAGKLRLAELKRAYETAAMLQATGDTKGATGVAEYFAGRGITGKASAVAYNQFSGKGGLIEGIKKGASSAELTTRAAEGYRRQADMMSTTGRFGGDTSGLMTSGFGQQQEFITRSNELRKKAKEAGYGEDVTAYIEAEQKAKKETKDKTTQQNAEVIQSQQKTAQILDKANLAIYEIAANVMNPAMEDFEKATDLFATAVGIKPKKKEEPPQKAPAPTENIKPRPSDNLKAQVWDSKYAKGWNADGTPKATTKSEPAPSTPSSTGAPISGGGTTTPPSKPPVIADAKPSGTGGANPGKQSKPSESLSGNAARLSQELEKQGITNPIARRAIIMTAAKESGLNPQVKESGAAAYLKTLASRGLEYIWKVFPQLKPGGRVAKAKGYGDTGVPASELNSVWSKGDEAFFDYVYGGLSTNPFAGDGYKYRGRGLIGITGRTVYDKVGQQVGKNFVENPDLVATDFESASAAAAGYIFMARGGKQKALADLNAMKDPNEALKYTLNTVAGLGHKAADFEKEGSHLHEQLRKASQFSDLGDSAVKVAKASTGAMFEGPAEGYFVQLHGKEFVGNQEQLSAIKKLIDMVDQNGMLSETTKSVEVASGTDTDDLVLIEKFTTMLESKTDELLEKIKFGNRVDTDLLNYSQG